MNLNLVSVLKKKCNSIYYHATREYYATNKSSIEWNPSARNKANLLTKVFHGIKKRDLVAEMLADIYEFYMLPDQ